MIDQDTYEIIHEPPDLNCHACDARLQWFDRDTWYCIFCQNPFKDDDDEDDEDEDD